MFDLLTHSSLLRRHATVGKVGFGINHALRDFRTRKKKNLDLVVCTPNKSAPPRLKKGKRAGIVITTFADLAPEHEIQLEPAEAAVLADLPALNVVSVGSVCLALEAKAVMTAHIAALPRLHDELDSSQETIHGHADEALAAGFVMINFANQFTSPDRNKHDLSRTERVVNSHDQPKATERTIEKVTELRRRSKTGDHGFDAIGIMLVDCANDGSPCNVVTSPPAPPASDPFHYDQLIERVAALYQTRFHGL